MSALDPGDDRRLKASLARLASNHDGEVIAAVAAVGRILGKAGLGFADLGVAPAITYRPPPTPAPPQSNGWRPAPGPVRADLLREHQRQAARLLACGHPWDSWELQFLSSIRARRKELTPGQRNKLSECVALAEASRKARGGGDADF